MKIVCEGKCCPLNLKGLATPMHWRVNFEGQGLERNRYHIRDSLGRMIIYVILVEMIFVAEKAACVVANFTDMS